MAVRESSVVKGSKKKKKKKRANRQQIPDGFVMKQFLKVNVPGQLLIREMGAGGGFDTKLYESGKLVSPENAPEQMKLMADNRDYHFRSTVTGKLHYKVEIVNRLTKVSDRVIEDEMIVSETGAEKVPIVPKALGGPRVSGPHEVILDALKEGIGSSGG